MFMPKWFQLFLASLCILGAMLLFFGSNNAATTSLRELDASLGLVRRPKTSRILERSQYIFRPIKTEAFAVSLLADVPRIIEQAIRLALNFLISLAVDALTKAVLGLFSDIIGRIEGWIGQVEGLRENQSSFEATISMKGFQITECLNKSTTSLTDEIIGEFIPSKPTNSTARQLRQDYFTNTNAPEAAVCGALEIPYSTEYNGLRNAIASVRINNLIVYGEQSQQQQVRDADNSIDQGVGGGGEESQPTDIGPLPSQEAIEDDILTIAQTVVDAACVDESENNQPEPQDSSVIGFEQINSGGGVSTCFEGSIRTGVMRVINIQLSEDIAIRERIADQIKSQAPADCKFGWTEVKDDGASLLDAENETANIPGTAVENAKQVEAGNLSKEQCDNLDRMPSAREQVASSASSSTGGGGESFNFGSIINGIKDLLNGLVDDVLDVVFNFFEAQLAKLAATLGNSYVTNAIGGAANSIRSSARTGLTDIQNQINAKF